MAEPEPHTESLPHRDAGGCIHIDSRTFTLHGLDRGRLTELFGLPDEVVALDDPEGGPSGENAAWYLSSGDIMNARVRHDGTADLVCISFHVPPPFWAICAANGDLELERVPGHEAADGSFFWADEQRGIDISVDADSHVVGLISFRYPDDPSAPVCTSCGHRHA